MATSDAPDAPLARQAALDRILLLVVLLTEDMTESLARRGLSTARVRVVWHLVHSGPCTQRSLADALQVSPRNVTGLVDGLVVDGFVQRKPHPRDRRATLVTLTRHGRQVAEDLQRERREFAEQLFDGMPPRRFDGLVAGLDDVLDRIHRLLEEAGQPAAAGAGR